MKKRYPDIQILRGVLFILILAFHCGVPYADFGWCFVISSFFLVRKHYGNDELDVKSQFKHRILRLYPPYIAVLVIGVLYALLLKTIPYDVIAHLLASQNYLWMITDYHSPMQPMTAHTWTLSIEVWCGLVWLILLKRLSRKSFMQAMYITLLVGIAYRIAAILYGADIFTGYLFPLAHFDAFACGSLLAVTVKEKRIKKRIGSLSIIGIAGIIACIALMANRNGLSFGDGYRLLSSPSNYLNDWFTGNIYLFISLFTTGLVGLIYLYDSRNAEKVHNTTNATVLLGDHSYEMYLFHWPILVVVKHIATNWAILFLISFAVTVIATFSFCVFYDYLKRYVSGRKTT